MTHARRALLLCSVALAIPTAHAAWTTTWDFRNAQVPGEWDVNGWSQAPVPGSGGLLIDTQTEGRMARSRAGDPPADTVRFEFSEVGEPTQLILLWQAKNQPAGTVTQLPFEISKPGYIELELNAYPQWNRDTDLMGIALPAHARVRLALIEWKGWSFPERVAETFKSFWTFDSFKPYSINFLWGPVLRSTPLGRHIVFNVVNQPPQGRSGNWILYVVLAVALAWTGFRLWLSRDPSRAKRTWRIFFLCVGALWLLYDARMGAEILSYAAHDYRTYTSQPEDQRAFRHYRHFYRAAQESLPYLQERPRFAFIGPESGPFLGRVRYMAYPSRPLFPDESLQDVNTWFIFYREDVRVDERGRLLLNDEVLVQSGSLLKDFGSGTILYRTTE